MVGTVLLMTEATQVALIVGSFGFAGIVVTSIVQIMLSRRKSDQVVATIKQEVIAGNEKVAQAVDGQLSKYVQEVRRAERSVGQQEGGEAERTRPPDLPSNALLVDAGGEPIPVHDAEVLQALTPKLEKLQDSIDGQTTHEVLPAKDQEAK